MSDPWDWSVEEVVAHIGRHSGDIFGGIGSVPEGRESHVLDRDSLASKLRHNAINGRALLCRVNHPMLQMHMGLLMSDQRNALLAIIERLRAESPKYQRFRNPQNTQINSSASARPPVAAAPLNASGNSTTKEKRRLSNLVTEPLNLSVDGGGSSTNTERRRVHNLETTALNPPQRRVIPQPVSGERNAGIADASMANDTEGDGSWDYLAERWNDADDDEIISVGEEELNHPQPRVLGEGNAGIPDANMANNTEGHGSWDYLAERWNDADDDEIISVGEEDEEQDEEFDDAQGEDDSITEPPTEGPTHEWSGQTSHKNKLSDNEVLEIIHSHIDEYTSQWIPGKHADEVLDQAWDAYELWHELHDQEEEEQERVIQKTKEQIEYYELRVNVIIQEIIESKGSWTNVALLKKQCGSLNHMLDWLEQEKWELDVYEMPSPPPKINYVESALPALNTVGSTRPQDSTARPGRTSSSTVQAQLNQLSNRAIRQDDSAPEQIVDSEAPQLGASRNQGSHSAAQRPNAAPRPGPVQVEIIDLGSSSDTNSNSSEMDVDEFHTPLSRRAPTEQLNPLPSRNTERPTGLESRTVSGERRIFPLRGTTVAERTVHLPPTAQRANPPSGPTAIRTIPLPSAHTTPSDPMIIAVLPSVERPPAATLPPIPFPRSINTQHRTRPAVAPMVLTPPPALPSTHPVSLSPSTASYATISRWTWPDLLVASDRKRIVLKVLQEMSSGDREIIRARITTVKKADLVREITECVGMMVRGAQGIRGFLPRDVAKIVKFTRLFFCWWLAGDYFVHDANGDGEGSSPLSPGGGGRGWGGGGSREGAGRKEIAGWRLRELEQCLREGETEDPRLFCEWVRWVMERTFSREALERLWAPSQAEVIVISDDEG